MTITQRVNTEIRVLLARREMSKRDLAALIGMSQVAISRRMTGQIPWDLAELEMVAKMLEVDPGRLLAMQGSAS
jgi:DNA-binding Xre family transcriptional regulator